MPRCGWEIPCRTAGVAHSSMSALAHLMDGRIREMRGPCFGSRLGISLFSDLSVWVQCNPLCVGIVSGPRFV